MRLLQNIQLPQYKYRLLKVSLLLMLVLSTLACGFLDRPANSTHRPVRVVRLPTLTPTTLPIPPSNLLAESADKVASTEGQIELSTSLPTPNPTTPTAPAPLENSNPAATAIVTATIVPAETTQPANPAAEQPLQPSPTTTPLPTQNPTVVNTPIAQPGSALAFANVRMFSDPNEPGLLLYGDVINQSSSPQELQRVTGTFVDAQGQVIANEDNIADYAPIQIIPTQGRVPFELSVQDIQAAANFNLRAEAQPSNNVLRQDFEITTTAENSDEFGRCFEGTLRNPGANLGEYIVVAAILYDAQNNVISFGDIYLEPEVLRAGQIAEFEVCADAFSQPVSRYELRAWGQ